jgi:hypothetical protein
MAKAPVGHVQGRSARAEEGSLRDQIVDGEGSPLDPDEAELREALNPETQIEPTNAKPEPRRPRGDMEKLLRDFGSKPGYRKLDERQNINYFGCLDDIIADLYEKQGAAYRIVLAVLQQFEQGGNNVPFDEDRFKKICGNLSMVQASKEIAHLYGLGPEHADKVASLMIDRFFGPIPK